MCIRDRVIAAAVLLLQVVVEIAEAVTPVVEIAEAVTPQVEIAEAVTPQVKRMLPRKVTSLLETPMVLRVLHMVLRMLHMVAVTALRVLFPKLQRTVTLT